MKLPHYEPMLPTEAANDEGLDFIHEIKWDGYRVLAYYSDGYVQLQSRGGLSLNGRFPTIVGALRQLRKPVVLDGEVVSLDQEGRPNFSLLQQQPEVGSLRYIVFDLLHLGEKSVCAFTWRERRTLLDEQCHDLALITISPLLFPDALSSLEFARENGLEGIVSKKETSIYLPGKRSTLWRKQKIKRTLDCVVVGVRLGEKRVRSLCAGMYGENGKLCYVGNVGSGLNFSELQFLEQATALLSIPHCPVVNPPETDETYTWFKPHLVAEIEFLEFTPQLRLRHPVFSRFRFDKRAVECRFGAEQE